MLSSSAQHSRLQLKTQGPNLHPSAPSAARHDCWASFAHEINTPMTILDCIGLPLANARPFEGHFTLRSHYKQSSSNSCTRRNDSISHAPLGRARSRINSHRAVCPTTTYSIPATFTASNAQTTDNFTSMPSVDTRFDVYQPSLGSDARTPFCNHIPGAASPPNTAFVDHPEYLSSKCRCDSLQHDFELQSLIKPQAQMRRRRVSKYAELGSARAIYLEKNRKAVSKCRNNQKRCQEKLVQEARDVELCNKLLEAEVEWLRSGMRDLMCLVEQHTNCSGSRLKLYAQREACQLAGGGWRDMLPSPQSEGS